MSYTFKQNLVSSSKYSIKCTYAMTPEFIVVHNTSNDASAENEIKYMISNNNQVSYHYAVDDKYVIQGLPTNRNAWHAGDGASGNGNRKGLAIEICYSKSGGSKFDEAEKNASKFIAQLLKERGWGIDKVKKHQDFSGKYCPHRTIDKGWQRFLNMIQAELDKLNGKTTAIANTIASSMLIRGKEASQPIYSHPDATSQVVEHLKQGEMKTVFELSKDGRWGKIGENQWLGIDYVELFLAPFLYNPNNHKQKIYSHPDATSQVQGDLPSNKFTPILEVSANQWGRTAQGWVSLAYGGLIETSMLVKANKGKVNGYSHPDTTSKIIATLDNDIVVTVIELSADGNWGYCKSGYWIPLEVVTIL